MPSTRTTTRPAHHPRAADCSNCGGSGVVWVEQDGAGKWKKEAVTCPVCNGSGVV
ncbi:DnaJ-class molecular chaperone [Nocardiopsis mwathae]|uniref:DnaJ-class molecular chaperone n=1 Tax=Nocardiopsis mwathae TaxID=1472723 RepID=A0A7W9YHG0_9ACTN|nr:DnaJ-class molecular chaperone [Nocardiopsis mwathae]